MLFTFTDEKTKGYRIKDGKWKLRKGNDLPKAMVRGLVGFKHRTKAGTSYPYPCLAHPGLGHSLHGVEEGNRKAFSSNLPRLDHT